MTEPQTQPKMTKDQLKLLALKQRIGEITSQYEDQMADLRAEYTQQFGAMQDVIHSQESDMEKLQEQLKRYQDAEKDVQVKEDGNTKSAK